MVDGRPARAPMTREHFVELVREAMDSLPARFRQRIENVAVVVEDLPPAEEARKRGGLLLGMFQGVPTTQKSVWNVMEMPSRVVLYQQNIEAVCRSDDDIREQVRLTVLHELGHYFGMTEDQLRDV